MRIKLKMDGEKQRRARLPYPDAGFCVVSGACPHCGAAPFKVAGRNMRIAPDDRAYESDGYCLVGACAKHVGTLRAETETLFGVREDEAVLVHGRCRVY